jgi:hypothetical protein
LLYAILNISINSIYRKVDCIDIYWVLGLAGFPFGVPLGMSLLSNSTRRTVIDKDGDELLAIKLEKLVEQFPHLR